jgi:Flp pilus assembly protein TadG
MMRRGCRRDAEGGAVAVELIIILPILVVLLFGLIEFGVAMSKFQAYMSAAREGARYAAVHCRPDSSTGCTNSLIATKVQSTAVGYSIGPGSPSASITCDNTTVGQQVMVSWQQNIQVDIAFFGTYTMRPTLRASFRCES